MRGVLWTTLVLTRGCVAVPRMPSRTVPPTQSRSRLAPRFSSRLPSRRAHSVTSTHTGAHHTTHHAPRPALTCSIGLSLAQRVGVHQLTSFTGDLCPRTRFSLAEIPVRDGTAGGGRMTPPASTRISARMKCVQGHSSRVNTMPAVPAQAGKRRHDGHGSETNRRTPHVAAATRPVHV